MNEEIMEELARRALAMRTFSYAPYSHFTVGAALLAENGRIYMGCNIENAAYGPSICAERVAIVKAVSEGARRIMGIAIAGGPEGKEPEEYCAPCGTCRQVMSEFADGDMTIVLCKTQEDYRVHTLAELLPLSFDLKNE